MERDREKIVNQPTKKWRANDAFQLFVVVEKKIANERLNTGVWSIFVRKLISIQSESTSKCRSLENFNIQFSHTFTIEQTTNNEIMLRTM